MKVINEEIQRFS
jgi:ATP-dependent Lon protease